MEYDSAQIDLDEVSVIGTRSGIGKGFVVKPELFGISQADRLHHIYILGKTGTGKSTLLRNLILQDIEAGRGVALLDPHGDLAEELLDHIPPWRTDHVTYFNPADLAHPIGVNFLGAVPADERWRVVQDVLSVFMHIWELSEEKTPLLLNVLKYSLAALMERKDTTLLGLYRMLIDSDYRERITEGVADPQVRQYWKKEFAGYDKQERARVVGSTLNKVGLLLSSPPLRNSLGQIRNKVDFSFLMNHERILIANLSKGRLGEQESKLFGSILLIKIYLAALERARIPEHERQPFHLFADEFQNFGTSIAVDILSESRKYALPTMIGHQFTRQLTPEMRDAIFGNVGSIIAFRVGQQDAEGLAKEFGLRPDAFTDLARHEIRVRLQQEGEVGSPFLAKTLPPLATTYGRKPIVVRRSRRHFGRPQEKVEGNIAAWLSPKKKREDQARQRRGARSAYRWDFKRR